MDISQVDLDKYTPSSSSEEGPLRCKTHGKVARKRFMMPKPYSAAIADYVCSACFENKFPEYAWQQRMNLEQQRARVESTPLELPARVEQPIYELEW